MRDPITRPETRLFALCGMLLLAALAGPHVSQPAHYHAFADQRTLWGLPHALDVLSNLPFLLAGGAGLWLLRAGAAVRVPPVQRACALLFFAGLVLTAGFSGWYHLQPHDTGLAVDRAGMSVAFAGLLGLLVAAQVSERAGAALALALLLLAPASVAVAWATGNILPWVAVQGGGLALIAALGFGRTRPGALQVRWAGVLAVYVLAKLFEAGDHHVFEASGQLLSGHTLKHLVAAGAAWPVLAALAALRPVQNAASSAATVRA
jgi:hypothetical protein